MICDDQVLMSLQYSTQWDSFAHVGSWFDADGDGKPEMVYYNGYRAHQHIKGPSDYQFVGDPCDGRRAPRRWASRTSRSRRSRAARC